MRSKSPRPARFFEQGQRSALRDSHLSEAAFDIHKVSFAEPHLPSKSRQPRDATILSAPSCFSYALAHKSMPASWIWRCPQLPYAFVRARRGVYLALGQNCSKTCSTSSQAHLHTYHQPVLQLHRPARNTALQSQFNKRDKEPRFKRQLHVCSAAGTKVRQVWQCDNCEETSPQWTGKCKGCGEWNSLHQVEVVDESAKVVKGGGGGSAAVREALTVTNGSSPRAPFQPRKEQAPGAARLHRGTWTTNAPSPQRLSDVLKQGSGFTWRLPLAGPTGAEVSRVLGGGIVPGSLTLFSGDPGIGKSTMLLQMADLMASITNDATDGAEPGTPMRESDAVLYITAEESVDQVSNRADRMGLNNAQDNIYLYSAVQMSEILRTIVSMQPRAVIVDSIQTVYLEDVTGSAGSVSQIRECTTALMRVAKDQRIPIFIVGHVTKAGEVAGPKVLEHIVDTTLYMEGEHGQSFRLLRVNKNRFGKTDEIGVFSMDESGLQPVPNPSAFFLTDRSKPQGASSAISVTMGGSRPMLVEIQALCTPFQPGQGAPLRAQNGVQKARLYQILAILQKYCKLSTYTFHIHTNVVGGFILNEPATDLAVAIAIASSIRDQPVRNDLAFVGEIGLGGELRPISNLERRVAEALKLGFTSCLVPQGSKLSERRFRDIQIIECANINEAIKVSLP